ncbi:ADP-heptose--lipooligosaccharide heptosyltransferase II [hydrothermal vent metagenome]|uniref:lipopolysaccharide heptosyltransferase II n=1 Tax=hydrothermal vent metagenome TaxID=652676 RepID=A0A3B0ZS96_9ZZZZ
MASPASQRILVVGPSWVGDMVMAQSLFITLQQRYPSALIDVVAPQWSGDLLGRMPEVNDTIEMPLGQGQFEPGVRYRLGQSLQMRHYDQAIIIPRSWKSAIVPAAAKIPQRIGYRGEMRYGLLNDIRPLDKSVLTQTVQRYVSLGLASDASLPPDAIPPPHLTIDLANQSKLMAQFSLNIDLPVVGFMPGAEYGPAKCWPVEYYGELASRLIAKGYQVWLFGSPRDQPSCAAIAEIAPLAVDLSGKTKLVDAVDLIALCKLVVCNDSGLMHIAAATGRHVVALYGSSTPDYTPPQTEQVDICYLGLSCSPCFERECPRGDLQCLRNITVDAIFEHCLAVKW